jgi:hypothetical protein
MTKKSPLPAAEEISTRFEELKNEWWELCQWFSASDHIARHPAHRSIVAMGSAALPLILSDLKRDPKFWYRALEEISGENPVPYNYRSNVPKMREYWINWGIERGYIS